MNRLPSERRAAIIRALIEGNSVRSACRITGAAKGTVLKLLVEIGDACGDFQNRHFVQLGCKTIQCDEIWSWVGQRESRMPVEQRGRTGRGDAWTWTALCADSKLLINWHIGRRDADAALAFMEDLASRLANRVQLTTDGHKAYLRAVEGAFGWNGVDYAMLVKLYGSSPDNENYHRRYAPAPVVGTRRQWIMGQPNPDVISTSYAEAHNLTMRMRNRRMTRLTTGYSKKWENHMAATSLYAMAYNFVHVHHTLTKERKGIHTTPAMAAGVTDHVWKVDEIVNLLTT